MALLLTSRVIYRLLGAPASTTFAWRIFTAPLPMRVRCFEKLSSTRSRPLKTFSLSELTPTSLGTVEYTFVDWKYTFVDWTFRTAKPEALPPSCPLVRLQRLLDLASRSRNVAFDADANRTNSLLADSGFTDRIHSVHTLPLTRWTQDTRQNRAGELMGTLIKCYHPDSACKSYLEDLSLDLLV